MSSQRKIMNKADRAFKGGYSLRHHDFSEPGDISTGLTDVPPVGQVNSHMPYLDSYTARVLECLFNCFLVSFLGIFGIVGNSLNIAVLRQHGFQEPTNIILTSLSISDLIFSFVAPITRLKCLVSLFDTRLSITVHTFVTTASFMPKFVCLATSFAYVAVIAMERFVAVFFPFHVSKIFTKNVTLFLVISIPVTVTTSLSPTFATLKHEWRFDSSLNRTFAVLAYTDFYLSHQHFIDVYAWVGLNNFFCASSISIVTLCCLAIGFKLTRAAIKREMMTNRATGYDVKVVKMLVTVCIVYLFVAIPTIALYSYFLPNFIFENAFHELIDNICVVLYSFNASVNFLVYVTMSQKFASTYKRLLACKTKDKKKRLQFAMKH